MTGICGTCARPAEANASNQGYSDCCNDRIEYGDEAAQTVKQHNCEHVHTTELRERHSDPGYVWVIESCVDCGYQVDESLEVR